MNLFSSLVTRFSRRNGGGVSAKSLTEGACGPWSGPLRRGLRLQAQTSAAPPPPYRTACSQGRRIAFLFLAVLALSACATVPQTHLATGATPGTVAMADGTSIQYETYIPAGYHGGKAPLLIFLHGSGEAGNDVTAVMGPGPWQYAKDHPDFPFIIVAPQQPRDEEWDPQRLKAWLDEVETRLPVDKHRVYLTGLSLGGGGSWDWAMKEPKRFAAIAPVSGYSNLKTPCAMKGDHVWAFHGEIDDQVPIADEQTIVDAAKACGVDVKYTIYPRGNHNAWDATYANPELYAWLLSHKN